MWGVILATTFIGICRGMVMSCAANSQLWTFENRELGTVVLEAKNNDGELLITLNSHAVSLGIDMAHGIDLGQGEDKQFQLVCWRADTYSGDIAHARAGVLLCIHALFCLNAKLNSVCVDRALRFLLPEQLSRHVAPQGLLTRQELGLKHGMAMVG